MRGSITSGLKAVSVFEAGKGILALFLSLFLSIFANRDFEAISGEFERRGHIDLSSHIPGIVRVLMHDLTDSRLHLLLFLASVYALMRFIEAYGLWFDRRWAEWFSLVSGGVYLPVELYELARGFSLLKLGFLAANLLIVVYMTRMLMHDRSAKSG